MLKIVTVKSLSQVEDFVMFPFKLYKDCNYWVPPIIKEEIEAMNFEKNPVFKNAEAEFYLAYDENGNIVGIKFGKEEEYEIASNDYALTDPMYPANYLSDASFYRIKELSISYNMVDLLSRFKLKTINDIQIYYSIQNYWTKTNYSGSDPEVNWSGANAIDRGQDFLTAQHPRVYTLGLTITF